MLYFLCIVRLLSLQDHCLFSVLFTVLVARQAAVLVGGKSNIINRILHSLFLLDYLTFFLCTINFVLVLCFSLKVTLSYI